MGSGALCAEAYHSRHGETHLTSNGEAADALACPVLHEFLRANRDELVGRCRVKVAQRPGAEPTRSELEFGIPAFLDQLIAMLNAEQLDATSATTARLTADIGRTAEKHGGDLLSKGFTVDQVVHDYGDLCQSLTELAHELRAPISVDEFHTFNRCLDQAIADSVTEFARRRDRAISDESAATMNERLGYLAHEMRNLLNAATLAFHAIKVGNVAISGATGSVLERSLAALRVLVDQSLADVRLTAGLKVRRESVAVDELLVESHAAASLEASDRGLTFRTSSEPGLVIDADRQMVSSAIANLVQNAFKFTHPRTRVSLIARAAADRVLIEVEDHCGGIAETTRERLFRPFEQDSFDRSGIGLGLSISRRAIEANGGTLDVRNHGDHGCIFTIDLPRGAKLTVDSGS